MRSCLIAVIAGLGACAAPTDPPAGSYSDQFGQWAPDGRIVFGSDRAGDPEIYLARIGGCARRLTQTPGRDAHPAFSPDGQTIVFQSPRNEGDTRLFTMKPDGSEQRELIPTKGFCGVPVYAPDGKRIALMCAASMTGIGTAANPWRIFLVDADGKNLRQITDGPGNDQAPNWSPDGKSLVFYSDRSRSDQLYRMDVASGTAQALTGGPGKSKTGSYSPDGKSIVFMSDRDGAWNVWAMAADGSGARKIAHVANEFGQPLFSPDGKRLMAPMRVGDRLRIGLANPDGSGLKAAVFQTCRQPGGSSP
jgi:TolB protein